jgi:hypothetical protein
MSLGKNRDLSMLADGGDAAQITKKGARMNGWNLQTIFEKRREGQGIDFGADQRDAG